MALTYRLITLLDFGQFSSFAWPWIFKVKYGIFYISVKNGCIAMKWKANISIELKASDVTIRFYLGHNLERWGVSVSRIVTGVTSDVSTLCSFSRLDCQI